MSRTRGYGHIADHPRLVAADMQRARAITAAPLTQLPESLSYLPLLDEAPDQGATSSCVGNACSTSLLLEARVAGRSIGRPSRKLIYDFARLLDDPRLTMIDEGSRPAAAMAGMTQYGLVREERWPLSEANVNEDPPEDVFQHAYDAKIRGYTRLRPADIKRAVARGQCPVFAMPVDEAYEKYDGSGIYQGVTGAELGSHYQCVVGYGPGYFVVCNSWGPLWGSRGTAAIAEAWFAKGAVSDILVPRAFSGDLS